MSRLVVPLLVMLGSGVTLALSGHPRFQRHALLDRLTPYRPGTHHEADPRRPTRPVRLSSIAGVGRLLIGELGAAFARITADRDGLAVRLERIGATESPEEIRSRQLIWGFVGLLIGTLVALAVSAPWILSAALVVAPGAVAVLWREQQVRQASIDWQRRLEDELPIVAEQLGMLLGSGYSLGGAMQRLSDRGNGVVATGLRRVLGRIRHGMGDVEALREWASGAQVPSLDRLVSVLALNWEADDLGALISAEARSMRRDAQRRRVEIIERRGQQVWIPVTVATLLPGVIFMTIPFIDAMNRLVGA